MSKFPLKKRQYGGEAPYIPLGPFKLRIPLVHFTLKPPILLQGLFIVAVNVASIPFMETCLPGLSYEEYLAMMLTFDVMICVEVLLGNPTYSGYITPGIPLVIAYITSYASADDRVYAITAVALELTLMFLILGCTGLADKVMKKIPDWFKGGIMYGACISALTSIFGKEGKLSGQWICGFAACGVLLFATYSLRIAKKKQQHKLLSTICAQGIIVGCVVGIVVGFLTGEIKVVPMEWGINSLAPLGSAMAKYSIFTHGVPALKFWIWGLPTAFVDYTIAFGDFVLADSIFKECDKARDDEYIEYKPNRSNIMCGIRNLFMALTVPSPTMAGPIWAGGCISIGENYKEGRERMDSIYDGMFSLILGPTICNFLKPCTSFFKPIGALGAALLLAVQGFATAVVANSYVKGKVETGIAFAMGLAMNLQSNLAGMVVGIVLYLLLGAEEDDRRKEEKANAGKAEVSGAN